MWTDEFNALPMTAQWLHLALRGSPDWVGVWRPRMWAERGHLTVPQLEDAASALIEGGWLVVDETTAEYRVPGVTVGRSDTWRAVLAGIDRVESATLRAVILWEVQQHHAATADRACWRGCGAILDADAIDPGTYPLGKSVGDRGSAPVVAVPAPVAEPLPVEDIIDAEIVEDEPKPKKAKPVEGRPDVDYVCNRLTAIFAEKGMPNKRFTDVDRNNVRLIIDNRASKDVARVLKVIQWGKDRNYWASKVTNPATLHRLWETAWLECNSAPRAGPQQSAGDRQAATAMQAPHAEPFTFKDEP